MSTPKQDFSNHEISLEESQRVQRLLLRLLPFWPLVVFALILGMLGGYLYIRYQVPIFLLNAKIIVNDESQAKSVNVEDLFKLDTRNLSVESEREMEILRSRNLLREVVTRLQLNINYSQKGFINSGQYVKNIPFYLKLEAPDSIKGEITGEIEKIGNNIKFRDILYPLNIFIDSKFGRIKWSINKDYHSTFFKEKWSISIIPVQRAVNEIQKIITLKPISKQSSIIEISYEDPFPERGVMILDTLIKLYGISTVNYKSIISENTLKFLDERLGLISEELNGVEKSLQAFKTQQGIIDLGAEGTLFLGQLKEADNKIAELDVQLDILNQIEKYVTNRNNSKIPIPATLGNMDPVLINLLTQLYQAEFDLDKLRQISGKKNQLLEVLEESIIKLKSGINYSIKNLKMNIIVSRQRLTIENNKLNTYLGKIPLKERLLLNISRQQNIKNAIYTFLLQKREEAAIASSLIIANHRVIEGPQFVGLIYPIPSKIYGNAILISIILVALFIYLFEFANSRLLFRSQIESDLPEIPVIGELIFEPKNLIFPIVTGSGKRTLIAEQFREIRTNLKYVTANVTDKAKVILVTSSITEEGKSFVAINTAISIALTGARVVLLEFDLRRPKISKQLGIVQGQGLSNYLIQIANEKDIIVAHPTIDNFSIIQSGPIPPNPAELMGGQRLLDLMIYLKENFEFIIIDSPPIAAVTDAKILAVVAHVTLYIIRYNYTSRSFLKLIRDSYQKDSMPNINIIFNGVKVKKILGYGYGKGYGYGYGYGEKQDDTERGKKKSFWKKLFRSKK